MVKIACLLTLLVAVLVCLLPAVPAQAAAARTFVSAAGSDSNNCTNVATPCRHLAAAYAATAANGEIYVLDPANYGSLTITGPVSIEGHGWASIAPVSGENAITINANAGDAINIIGVVLDGTALAGTNGIVFNSSGSLTVADSVVRNFSSSGLTTGNGILIQPASGPISFAITNTIVSNNGLIGIYYRPPSGSASATGSSTMSWPPTTKLLGLRLVLSRVADRTQLPYRTASPATTARTEFLLELYPPHLRSRSTTPAAITINMASGRVVRPR
jgi:hypothetical protein